jgi:broad specificity phosphatase PhoE
VHSLGHVPVRVDERLRPLEPGQGPDGHHLSWSARDAEWDKGRDPVPPKGESFAQLEQRVGRAIVDLAAAARAGRGPWTILIVAHSEVVVAELRAGDKSLPLHAAVHGVHNASISVVDVGADDSIRIAMRDRVP